jgi:predicted amidohydrolase
MKKVIKQTAILRIATIQRIVGIVAIIAIIGLTVIACNKGGSSGGSSGGSKISNGTYVDDSGKISCTFSGNKLIMDAYGRKAEGTYQIKDGNLLSTAADGETTTTPYELEGDKLTLYLQGPGTKGTVLTKK